MKMKTFFLLLATFLVLQSIDAQCINGAKSYPIYKLGAQLVDQFDTDGNEIVRIEYDLVFTSKETTRNLSADWEYTLVAFADDGVKDLDIKVSVYDDLLDQWTLVTQDNSAESFAIAVVKPPVDALYKVEVIVYQFNEGYNVARYGLMFVHE
jgi:hypothetical protein